MTDRYRLTYGADNSNGYLNDVLVIEIVVTEARSLDHAMLIAERAIRLNVPVGVWAFKSAILELPPMVAMA